MKAVFFDVDGTLIARDGSISAQTIASLRRLKEKGIRLFLATGRHTTELEEPLSRMRIDFDGYVTLNGQLTLDASFQVIDEASIDAQDAAILLAHADRRSFPIVTVEKDRLYINYDPLEPLWDRHHIQRRRKGEGHCGHARPLPDPTRRDDVLWGRRERPGHAGLYRHRHRDEGCRPGAEGQQRLHHRKCTAGRNHPGTAAFSPVMNQTMLTQRKGP